MHISSSASDPLAAALAVADWRRLTHALYADVRRLAASDPQAAHTRWRQGRDALFAQHPASPLLPQDRAAFTGLPVAGYDPAYRYEVEARTSTDDPAGQCPQQFVASTGTDGDVPYERVGHVVLPTPDGPVTLALWRLASYGGGLFLPVRDGSSGRTSYGGGRYVLDTVKGADLGPGAQSRHLVVDLNFAYNPSCAYDPAWACPLAPTGSTTTLALPVGELYG